MPLLRTLLLNGSLGLAGYWAARHAFRMQAGLPRFLAASCLALAAATLGMEVLGPPGYLNYAALLAWTATALVIAWVVRRCDLRVRMPAEPPFPASAGKWEAEAVLAVGLVVWVATIHGLNSLFGPVKVVSDGPIYHLYFAARWWKAGRLFLVAAPFGESVVAYFPAVGDLWYTWLLVGWGGDRLAKVGQVPFLLVAAMAAFGSARRLGAGVPAAAIATAMFLSMFPFLLFTLEPNVDTIFVAGYLVAAFFFLRYALGDDSAGGLAIGSLAMGGVLGTKPTGVVFGGLLIGAAALAVWLRRKSPRQALGHLGLLAILPLVMVGYWYGQNVWLTGNPLYPLRLEALGHVWLEGWYGSEAMRLSSFYIPVYHWRALVDILLAVFDPRLAPLWVAALCGAWSLGRRQPPMAAAVWAFSALAVANLAAYWILVPYRTQQRFMFQAAGLLVVPLARTLDRGRWLRILAAALLAIHLLTAQSWPFAPSDQDPPWDLSAAVPNTVPPLVSLPYLYKASRGIATEPDDVSWSVAMLVLGGSAVAGVWLWSRPGRRAQATAGTLLLTALALAIGYPFGTDPRALFYPNFRDYHRGWLQLDSSAGPSGARIAYAGTNLPYYLMGVDLRNEVRYINVDQHRGWLMHDYHRRARLQGAPTWPTPWPGWDRLEPDYDAWLANLAAEKIDLLAVASMNRPAGSLPDVDEAGFPIECRWADEHPDAFKPLYGVAERDPKFRVYRVRPARRTPPVRNSGATSTESESRRH